MRLEELVEDGGLALRRALNVSRKNDRAKSVELTCA